LTKRASKHKTGLLFAEYVQRRAQSFTKTSATHECTTIVHRLNELPCFHPGACFVGNTPTQYTSNISQQTGTTPFGAQCYLCLPYCRVIKMLLSEPPPLFYSGRK